MYLAHSSRRVLLRLVVVGVQGAGGASAVERLHARLAGDLLPLRERGSWRTRQLQVRAESLGAIQGYEPHVLLHGVEADGDDPDPCDLSGLRDIDGILLLASPTRVDADVAAASRLAACLGTMGYTWSEFPVVVALDTFACTSELAGAARARLASALGSGRPIVLASRSDADGLANAVSALVDLVGRFVREGRARVAQERPDGTPDDPDAAILVRSPLELHLYESLRPCACGATDFEVRQTNGLEGALSVTMRHRRCRRCGRHGDLRFAMPERALAHGPDWLGGPEPSSALDAGELIELSDRCAMAAKDDAPASRRSLVLAIALLEDALRLVIPGAGIPHERFVSSAGRDHLRYAGAVGLPRLRARLEAYRRRLPN